LAEAARHTNLWIGGANTAILLLSSFFVAWAVMLVKGGSARLAANFLYFADALGVAFLLLKSIEYALDYRGELIPALHFSAALAAHRGTLLFFLFYFVVTLLHALHVTIGIAALSLIARALKQKPLTEGKKNAAIVGGLYWHFVDAIWVLLFALLYLPGRSG
jgi:cytochrome c oxidase subunit 3